MYYLKTNVAREAVPVIITVIAVVSSGCGDQAMTKTEPPIEIKLAPPVSSDHKVQIHQLNAGREELDGWVRARSTSGGFTVLVPGKYGEVQQTVKTDKGNLATTHAIAMKTAAGVRYDVIAVEGGNPQPKETRLTEIVELYEKRGNLLEKTEFDIDGYPGIHVVVSHPLTCETCRIFFSDRMMYILTVDCPKDLTTSEADNTNRFLSSFSMK